MIHITISGDDEMKLITSSTNCQNSESAPPTPELALKQEKIPGTANTGNLPNPMEMGPKHPLLPHPHDHFAHQNTMTPGPPDLRFNTSAINVDGLPDPRKLRSVGPVINASIPSPTKLKETELFEPPKPIRKRRKSKKN